MLNSSASDAYDGELKRSRRIRLLQTLMGTVTNLKEQKGGRMAQGVLLASTSGWCSS